jgi:sugar lactone lactonase YvrE
VLSDSFVSVTPGGKIQTIVKEARWRGLSPNSMCLSDDEKTVYVGMRQFVARVTLKNGRVSFFTPDRSYLNQLPKEDEDRIRKVYGK